MAKTGAVIRAIPDEVTSIYEVTHKDKFPHGDIFFNPKYGRDMLHVKHKPNLAGQFMVAFAPNDSARLAFDKSLSFESFEAAAKFIIEQTET